MQPVFPFCALVAGATGALVAGAVLFLLRDWRLQSYPDTEYLSSATS